MHDTYLYNYVTSVFPDKVWVVKNKGPEALGVIGARILGMSRATGEVRGLGLVERDWVGHKIQYYK